MSPSREEFWLARLFFAFASLVSPIVLQVHLVQFGLHVTWTLNSDCFTCFIIDILVNKLIIFSCIYMQKQNVFVFVVHNCMQAVSFAETQIDWLGKQIDTQLADHNSRWWFDSQRSENLTILFVLSWLNNISKSAANSFAKQIFLQLTVKYFLSDRNIWLISILKLLSLCTFQVGN